MLHSPEVRESFYRLGLMAPDAHLLSIVAKDCFHDVKVGGYRFGAVSRRLGEFFSTKTEQMIPWVRTLLTDNDAALKAFDAQAPALEAGLKKGRNLGAGFGALLAIGSWNQLCRTMDNPKAGRFEKAMRWADFAASLGACVPSLPQLRLISFSFALVTAVFEAAFWHKHALDGGEIEPNRAASTQLLRALRARHERESTERAHSAQRSTLDAPTGAPSTHSVTLDGPDVGPVVRPSVELGAAPAPSVPSTASDAPEAIAELGASPASTEVPVVLGALPDIVGDASRLSDGMDRA